MASKQPSLVQELAKRFIFSQSTNSFLSFISLVSVAGVALGVFALIVVTGAVNGFENELTKSITGLNGDIILYSRANAVPNNPQIHEKIKGVLPEIEAITPTFIFELMVAGPKGVTGGLFEGVELSTIGEVTEIPNRIIKGKLPTPGREDVALGSALAEKIGVDVGDTIKLIAPFIGSENKEGLGQPKVLKVHVSGIVKMGMYKYDSKYVFTSLETVQNFLNQKGHVTTFKLKLRPNTDLDRAVDRLRDNFGFPYRAKSWSQLNRNLLYAIKLEKFVIALLITTIVIVAAFNVVSTLMMMIHDKIKEISILKAMGFRRKYSFRLVSLIGLGISFVGAVIGLLLGIVANFLLSKVISISLPAEIYNIDHLPMIVRWGEVGVIVLFALVISLIATFYPAIRAATRSPLDGIRYE